MRRNRRVALVYPTPLGRGGLAVQSANVAAGLSDARIDLFAIGPGVHEWPRRAPARAPSWREIQVSFPSWSAWRWLRSFTGAAQLSHDIRFGRTAAANLERVQPDLVYAFTQIGLESLEWARAHRIPTILESPNGHIRRFRSVYVAEHDAWCSGSYRGHPSPDMVRRVEAEYALADRIRASSDWARESLIAGGVDAAKIDVLQQPVDLERYHAPAARAAGHGPLRVVFVGTLDLRKGFVYLLDAARAFNGRVSLELVGGTVDRCTRKLLESHGTGFPLTARPGNPLEAYHRAEISVLPSLEDGFGFAAAEAMSCGLPTATTDACGAQEWVQSGSTGWIVPARSVDALVRVFDDALTRRPQLRDMGLQARREAERRGEFSRCDAALAEWVLASIPEPA